MGTAFKSSEDVAGGVVFVLVFVLVLVLLPVLLVLSVLVLDDALVLEELVALLDPLAFFLGSFFWDDDDDDVASFFLSFLELLAAGLSPAFRDFPIVSLPYGCPSFCKYGCFWR